MDTGTDRDLAARFSRMREEDRRATPSFPHDLDEAVATSHWRGRAVGLGFAATLVVGLMVSTSWRAPEEDPGALYANVMSNYQLEMDELMVVSVEIAPERSPLPQLIATEWDFATEENTP